MASFVTTRSSCPRTAAQKLCRDCRFRTMASIRVLLIRGSIFLNALLVAYLCLALFTKTPLQKLNDAKSSQSETKVPFVDENANDMIKRHPLGQVLLQNQEPKVTEDDQLKPDQSLKVGNLEGHGFTKNSFPKPEKASPEPAKMARPEGEPKGNVANAGSKQPSPAENAVEDQGGKEPIDDSEEYQEPPREVQERAGIHETPLVAAPLVEESPDPPLNSLERKMFSTLRECQTKPLTPRYTERGDYWILENYIPAAMNFRCDESITYTTHGDYTFLDNLDPLTSRWQGPVSVAVYAPGTDFTATVDTILYLRNCMAEGVKKYVTFHVYFHMNHVPKEVPTTDQLLQRKTACDQDPPKWTNVTTYRQEKKLLYPVNVARNIARANSGTYFNLPSDVELYPSINVIPEFFKMLKRPDVTNSTNPRVYVFPIFEIAEDQSPPETKAELQAMLQTKKAITFHKFVCPSCHAQPKSTEWQKAKINPGLSVFNVGKRKAPYNKWEPIYIGTEREPIYDERLSWEGKSDKMAQMYILCVRDYEFHILDNAFLVHRPGIKRNYKNLPRDRIVGRQSSLIKKKLVPEYKTLFGVRTGCII